MGGVRSRNLDPMSHLHGMKCYMYPSAMLVEYGFGDSSLLAHTDAAAAAAAGAYRLEF